MLERSKREMEAEFETRLENLRSNHETEVHKKSQEYSDKMEQDQVKYQQLFDEMQRDQETFKKAISEIHIHQNRILEEMDLEHKVQVEDLKKEEQDLFALSKALREQNFLERETHDNGTWEVLDKLREKNKEELARIIEAGMQHKADLTIGQQRLKDARLERDDIIEQINKSQTDLTDKIHQITAIRA